MSVDFSPDFYRRQPELWLANQSGHMALGAAMAILSCAGFLAVFGEFPTRAAIFALIAAAYLFRVEIIGQGWQGFDTVEDTLFVVIYGAGPVLYAFREIAPGSAEFIGNIWDVVPFLVVAVIHLGLGAAWRLGNRRRARDDKAR